jgi:hypothetical protein
MLAKLALKSEPEMPTAPRSLHNFQQEFSSYLRDPKKLRRPQGIPARPLRIYEELLFNNICGFIDACFPVAKSLFAEKRWRLLCRSSFRDWQSHTPYFSQIPEQFVRYIKANYAELKLPAYLPDLLHYEWLELAVDTAEDNKTDSADSRRLTLNPSTRYARYGWPVHRISNMYRPRKPQATFLLLHRNAEFEVKFLQINEITAQLLDILSDTPISAKDALKQLAKKLGYASPDALQMHGYVLLADLIKQNIVQGKLS